MDWNGFKGAAKPLDDIDLPREAATIGVGEDILHAFIDCESLGKPFDAKGRPIMLFEPHVLYRVLGEGAKRDAAVKAGLAYASWGQKPYPKDSYPRLLKAMAIDEAAALRACSWGMFQVMGDNFKMIGYASVAAMVKDMLDDAETHLRACIKFVKAAKIDDDLRRLDGILKTRAVTDAECAPVVRVYNGAGYAKNGYHTKFANSLNRWRKIPDTPFTSSVIGDDRTSPPAALLGGAPTVTEAQYKVGQAYPELLRLQTQLKAIGYPEVGMLDGKWGTKTRNVVLAFRADNAMPISETVDDALWAAVAKAQPKTVSKERASITEAKLAETSPVLQQAQTTSTMTKVQAGIGVATGAVVAVKEGVVDALPTLAPLREWFDLPGYVWFGIALAIGVSGLLAVRAAKGTRDVKLETFRQGVAS